MQNRTALFIMLAFIAGALMPLQAGINSRLARSVSNSVTAAFFSFATGILALCIYLLVTKQFSLDVAAIKTQPAWIWLGGLLGAVFVTSITLIIPKLGASLAFSLVIGGQLFISLLVDHYGWLGVPISPITIKKIAGILFVIAGVWLIRKQ